MLKVSMVNQKLVGLESEVLTLQWPKGAENPSNLSNFETLARKLRYQALGKACRAEDTSALFLGHHSDDNVETALIRLSQGHGRFGLAGFDNASPIPECHGLWGVSRSGDITTVEAISTHQTPGSLSKPAAQVHSLQSDINHYTATGGVYIFRPFQSFQKSRLEATCHAARVPFVVDPTNADHTLTIRNTVRYLLVSGDLPRALQRPSILALIKKSQSAKERLQSLADDFVKLIHVINFDFKTGALLIRLPFSEEVKLFEETSNNSNEGYPYINPLEVQLKVVRTLIDLVAPESDSQISQKGLSAAAKMLWPKSPKDTEAPDVFTLGDVHFQPQKQKRIGDRSGIFPHSYKKRGQFALDTPFVVPRQDASGRIAQNADNNFADPNVWLLSRQPFRRFPAGPVTHFEVSLPALNPAQKLDIGCWGTNSGDWTEWKLWDGRYWIRLRAIRQNKPITLERDTVPKVHIYNLGDAIPVTMKPITQEDITTIRQSELRNRYFHRGYSRKLTKRDLVYEQSPVGSKPDISRWATKAFDVLLACFAPRHIRKTIPVLWHAPVKKEAMSQAKTTSSPSKHSSSSPVSNLPGTHDIKPTTTPPLNKEYIAKLIASFPQKDQISEDETDNEAKYGNGQYEEDQFYNINDTQPLIAAPTFGRRTGMKIWVREPWKAIQQSNGCKLDNHDHERGSNGECLYPWVIEWDIVYKHVDPVTIRNLNWVS